MPADVAFDNLIASRGRLRILTALAVEPRCEFVRLRGLTQLTDGNLATHTRRLESAGFVAVHKSFRDRKPVTHVSLTTHGRDALERHAQDLMTALGIGQTIQEKATAVMAEPATDEDDDWVD